MNIVRNFGQLLGRQGLLCTALSLVATLLCLRFDYYADLPTSLIGIAVVFPIVFAISAAYSRREESLRYFASFKANTIALYYAHRDWTPGGEGEHSARARALALQLFKTLRRYFSDASTPDAEFAELYGLFSQLSTSIELLRAAGVPANEISRANQYLRELMSDFERMRNIYLYRTPRSLRTYSQVFLYSFPILFAPYFAFLAVDFGASAGLLTAALYSIVLTSLANIQELLENPFDELGTDDINLNIADYYNLVLGPGAEPT